MSKIVEDQLKQVQIADLTHFNPENNTYFIPQKKTIKLDVEHTYLIKLEDSIFSNELLKNNWNNGSIPDCNYLKADISKKLPNMIRVVAVGYNPYTNQDISYFWSGWLTLDEIQIIQKLQ